MRSAGSERGAPEARCWEMIEAGTYLDAAATLETAMPVFDRSGEPFLPVVGLQGPGKPPELLGAVFLVDALKVYNGALAATAAEEHS